MRLSEHQSKQVYQDHGIEPIPDDHELAPQLRKTFGDHTFFLILDGLYIWESVSIAEDGSQRLNALRVAKWADEDRTMMTPQNPEATTVFVTVAPDGGAQP